MRSRVLVVDDEALIRWSLAEGFRDAGWIVQSASTLAMARQCLQEAQWDLIVCDVKLPDGKGFELLAAARRDDAAPPFLLITAHGDPVMREAVIADGAVGLIDKPFELSSLIEQATQIVEATKPLKTTSQ